MGACQSGREWEPPTIASLCVFSYFWQTSGKISVETGRKRSSRDTVMRWWWSDVEAIVISLWPPGSICLSTPMELERAAAAAASTKNKKNGGPSGNNELKILWIFQLFSRWWPRASNSFIDPEAADAAMYTFDWNSSSKFYYYLAKNRLGFELGSRESDDIAFV